MSLMCAPGCEILGRTQARAMRDSNIERASLDQAILMCEASAFKVNQEKLIVRIVGMQFNTLKQVKKLAECLAINKIFDENAWLKILDETNKFLKQSNNPYHIQYIVSLKESLTEAGR